MSSQLILSLYPNNYFRWAPNFLMHAARVNKDLATNLNSDEQLSLDYLLQGIPMKYLPVLFSSPPLPDPSTPRYRPSSPSTAKSQEAKSQVVMEMLRIPEPTLTPVTLLPGTIVDTIMSSMPGNPAIDKLRSVVFQKMMEAESHKSTIFFSMLSSLSEDSMHAVSSHEIFIEIQDKVDIKAMWQLIKAVHVSKLPMDIIAKDAELVELRLMGGKFLTHVDLFRKTYRDAKDIGSNRSEEEAVVIFLRSLLNSPLHDISMHWLNNPNSGEYPAGLDEARALLEPAWMNHASMLPQSTFPSISSEDQVMHVAVHQEKTQVVTTCNFCGRRNPVFLLIIWLKMVVLPDTWLLDQLPEVEKR